MFATIKQILAIINDRLGGSDSASVVALPPALRDDLITLQYARVYAQKPTLYSATIIAVIIAALALPNSTSLILQLSVPALFIAMCLYWFIDWKKKRGRVVDARNASRKLYHTANLTIGCGIATGLWSVTILLDDSGIGRSFVPLIIMTAVTVAAHCMASIPRTAIIMIALTTLPTIVILVFSGSQSQITMGLSVFVTSMIHCRLMLQYYRQMVASLKTSHDMKSQANTDVITGLANRRAFNAVLASAFERAGADDMFGIALIDLDGFKQVNDQWGHAMGDAILRAVAERLVRASAPTDTVFRFGGDEFAVILQEIGPDQNIGTRATALLAGLAALDENGHVGLRIGASIGYAVYPACGETCDALLAAADTALYRAKDEGKGQIKGCDSSLAHVA